MTDSTLKYYIFQTSIIKSTILKYLANFLKYIYKFKQRPAYFFILIYR